MAHARRALLHLGTLLAATGCSSPPNRMDPACPAVVQQSLVNGSPQESYLGLTENQVRAIVEVVGQAGPSPALCSGVFVAPGWVVTAGHCLDVSSPQVLVGPQTSTSAALPVLSATLHPTADVALLHVDASALDAGPSVGAASNVEPIAPAGIVPVSIATGQVGEMAGYGSTESGASGGQVRFLTESVVALDAATVTVDGFGSSGACLGDSGGPLLSRAPDGTLVVLGVLSAGSATCHDLDLYVRLDSVRDWLSSVLPALSTGPQSCGTIASEGRCFAGAAVWCAADGTLTGQDCSGGLACGWDAAHMGYRCVDPAADPCLGADSVGVCRDNAVLRCRGGVLDQQPCGSCATCRVDGKTGGTACVGVS